MFTQQGKVKSVIIGGFLLLFSEFGFSETPILAPPNPDFIKYLEDYSSGNIGTQTDDGYGLGFISPPADLSHLKGETNGSSTLLNDIGFISPKNIVSSTPLYALGFIPPPVSLSHLKGKISVFSTILSLPTSYDLRNLGKVTSVKNQSGYGTCWAFPSYGSLESCLLPSEIWDFSENNMVNLHGFDLGFDNGGNYFMSTAYLTRWSGPIREKDDIYPNPGGSPLGLPVVKHIQNVQFLPERGGALDNNTIKQAIMNYGEVYTTFYYNSTYYNSTYYTYYYSGNANSNHAVTIVGWDDNFNKNRFSSPPPGNGAFILKNSWGTSWGENGYFYISYYDSRFGKYSAVFYNAEPIVNYSHVYQYDPLGWTNNYGYGSNTAWGANIFTSTGNNKLKAVGFYVPQIGSSYEIYIYKNVSTSPTSGSLAASKSGIISVPGYHTIVLDSPVSLGLGERFSVVLKMTTPSYTYPIAIEYPLPNYSSRATATSEESYVSSNGTSWSDITIRCPNTNVCLKAYVNSEIETRIRDIENEEVEALEKITIDGKLEYKDGNNWKKLGGKTVKVYVNDNYIGEDISDASLLGDNWDIKDWEVNLSEGTYTITARFEGDSTYNGSEGTATLKVNKKRTEIDNFSVSIKTKGIQEIEGTSSIQGTSSIMGVDLEVYPGQEITIRGRLQWTDPITDPGISGKAIKLKLGHKEIANLTTNPKGWFTCDYSVIEKEGEYTISAEFAGDDEYQGCSASKSIKVKKKKTEIDHFSVIKNKGIQEVEETSPTKEDTTTIKGVDLEVHHGQEITIKGQLQWVDPIHDPGISGKAIKLKLGHKEIANLTTDSNGEFTYDYSVTEKEGVYTILAEFAGDDEYQGCSASKSIKVKRKKSVISQFEIEPNKVLPGQSTTISGKLEWERTWPIPNEPISNASVGLYIETTHIATKTTGNDGRFFHSYTIPNDIRIGKYFIKAVFPGDEIYKPCEKSEILTIEFITDLTINPSIFNPYDENQALTISYYLYEPSKVTIEIYDNIGRGKVLIDQKDRDTGQNKETWYGTIDKGIPYDIFIAPSGTYKIKITVTPENGLGPHEKEISVEVK